MLQHEKKCIPIFNQKIKGARYTWINTGSYAGSGMCSAAAVELSPPQKMITGIPLMVISEKRFRLPGAFRGRMAFTRKYPYFFIFSYFNIFLLHLRSQFLQNCRQKVFYRKIHVLFRGFRHSGKLYIIHHTAFANCANKLYNLKYFPAYTHNRLADCNSNFLNELNKRIWFLIVGQITVLSNLQEIRINPIVQLWTHCYQRNKPDVGQSSAPRWAFFVISANWSTFPWA